MQAELRARIISCEEPGMATHEDVSLDPHGQAPPAVRGAGASTNRRGGDRNTGASRNAGTEGELAHLGGH
jgi:hypothetical protein